MEVKKVSIATAILNGISEMPYHFRNRCLSCICNYSWDIKFQESSSFNFNNVTIASGDTEAESKIFYEKFMKNFKKAEINDGDQVAVMFDEEGVIAIGRLGKNFWLDIRDTELTCKKFSDLNVIIESLVIF